MRYIKAVLIALQMRTAVCFIHEKLRVQNLWCFICIVSFEPFVSAHFKWRRRKKGVIHIINASLHRCLRSCCMAANITVIFRRVLSNETSRVCIWIIHSLVAPRSVSHLHKNELSKHGIICECSVSPYILFRMLRYLLASSVLT